MSIYNIKKWKVFRKIAAVSGTIQGTTWLVMAAVCIGMYYAKTPDSFHTFRSSIIDSNTNYIDLISFSFYDTLLYTENNSWEDRLLKPKNFHVIAWVYGVLSTCWLVAAVSECMTVFQRSKTSKYEAHIMMFLGSITLITCLLDLIVMSLAFKDYFDVHVFDYSVIDWDTTTSLEPTTIAPAAARSMLISSDILNDNENIGAMIKNTNTDEVRFELGMDVILKYKIGRKLAYGILIVMCTRGFLLWIFNFVSGLILLFISFMMLQAPPILKYDNMSIPRAKIDQEPAQDSNSFFGERFAEDYKHISTPAPADKKGYSGPSDPRYYNRDINNPLALNDNNRRNQHMFS